MKAARKQAAKKVMIVDDERLVRIGLIKTVEWQRWNMEVVADAPNGIKAYELFLQHRPDLVITDIVMPGMDGIELCEKIKSVEPRTKVVFLSCHRDFHYAQQGMALGASGYVLKTAMGENELDHYLHKLTEEWKQEQDILQIREEKALETAFRSWIDGFSHPEQVGRALIKAWPELEQLDVEVVLITEGNPGLKAREERGCWTDAADSFRKWMDDQDLKCIDIRLRHGRLFIVPSLLYADWRQHLLRLNIRYPCAWKKSGPLSGVEAVLSETERLLVARELEVCYNVRPEGISKAIMDAVMYIEHHLHEPIHSAEVADRVGLSRSHFSTIFKKETGVSYLQYVHQRRLEKACKLLASTDWKIHVIAEKIGIPDDKHFSKWFKKHMGLTPSEYRNQTK
jgi:two-component system response regulator YesN